MFPLIITDLVNLCKLRGDLLDNKLLFHLVVMVQGSKVQRLTDSGCLPSEISGTCLRLPVRCTQTGATHRQIEKNREAINSEPGTLNL